MKLMRNPNPLADDFRSDDQRHLENYAYGAAGDLHRKLADLEAHIGRPVCITVYSDRYDWRLALADAPEAKA